MPKLIVNRDPRQVKGLILRDSYWWIDKTVVFNDKKCRVRESTKKRDLSEAKEVFDKRTAEVKEYLKRMSFSFQKVKRFSLLQQESDYRFFAAKLIRQCKTNKRQKEFSLTIPDIVEMFKKTNGACSVTSFPLDFSREKMIRRKPFTPSVDRIDSSKGYTADNCRIVCSIVNYAMNQWGEGPLWTLIDYIKNTDQSSCKKPQLVEICTRESVGIFEETPRKEVA